MSQQALDQLSQLQDQMSLLDQALQMVKMSKSALRQMCPQCGTPYCKDCGKPQCKCKPKTGKKPGGT